MKFVSLQGLTSYEHARVLQLELVGQRQVGAIEDTVLFLEHHPVVTQGSGIQRSPGVSDDRPRHMPVPRLPEGVEFQKSERGGDLTYHGPGQLVVYPICRLDGQGFSEIHDLGNYLRQVESITMEVLAGLDIQSENKRGATGVWVGPKKIASVGVAVKRWVSYHGLALNVCNDLSPFRLFSPCGFDGEIMTSLAEQGQDLGPDWRTALEGRFMDAFRHHLSKRGHAPKLSYIKLEELGNLADTLRA